MRKPSWMATTLVGFGLVALIAWPASAQNRGRVTRDFAKIAAAIKDSKISLVQAIQAVQKKVDAPVIGAKSDIENDVLVYYVNCWINEKLTPVKVNSDNGEIAVIATVRAKPDAPQNVTPASKPTETPDAEKP